MDLSSGFIGDMHSGSLLGIYGFKASSSSYKASCSLTDGRSIRIRQTHCPWQRGSLSFPLLGLNSFCKSQKGLFCTNEVRSLVDETRHGNISGGFGNNKFNFRLRPRLRLLVTRLKRRVSVSQRSMLGGVATFLRKNAKRVTLSTLVSLALGVCYIFLKLSAVPTPLIVPYSDSVSSIRDGSVTKVLLEESSKRIYFNMNSLSSEENGMSEDKLSTTTVVDDNNNKVEAISVDNVQKRSQVASADLLKTFSEKGVRSSSPEWEYSTRKIDHDEKFLLNLMRQQGTSYSSAPPSVLASFRSIVITILTLWIPLTPLMWLLYRQVSAANSPAKKRRVTNQIVTFDDVEGVDTAKVELMEMCKDSFEGLLQIDRLKDVAIS